MAERMSGISTHILDLTLGRPAAGVTVRLEREDQDGWRRLTAQQTDADGRIKDALPSGEGLEIGYYRLGFETGPYFRAQGSHCFHPYIEIQFEVADPSQQYHVPLLVTPHSYSTYRGS
jgi:5-hydroxyisourate hydrolase